MPRLSGIIVIQNYQVILYTNVGFSEKMSLILTGVWGSVGTLSAVYAAFCFDLLGRRPTMFISWTLITLGSMVTCITWAVYEKGGSVDQSLGKGIITAMFFTGLGYAGPANTFMATYPAEIMPTAMRPVGIASAYIMQHILIIILVQFTPQAIETISWRFFLIFVCSSAISFVVFILFYPETRNKTLEELAAVFGDEVWMLSTAL
jgi:MFS family permease